MIHSTIASSLRRTPLRRAFVLAGAAILVAAGLAACSGTPATTDSGPKPTLTVGLTTPPTNLNPASNGSGQQTLFLSLANEPLTYLEPDGSIGQGLATKWGYVGKGNTDFQLTLRKNAKFSDGSPVNAAAVKTWLDYFTKAGLFGPTLGAKSVTTKGDYEVDIQLAAPNPQVPYLLSQVYNIGDVASPAAVADPKEMETATFGAGPYMLDAAQTVANSTYVYVPNPKYYDKSKVHYSKITLKVIAQPSTMLSAVQSGQVDVALGDYSTASQAAQSGLQVIHKDAGWVGVIFLDRTGKLVPALGNVKVRQALNYAVDRAAIVKGLLGSKYSTATSQPPTLDGTVKGLDDAYPYDPKKAKELLAEAGYPNGFTFSVTSMTYAGVIGDPLMQAVAGDLAKVGVTMTISSAGTQADYGTQLFSKKFPATGFVQTPVLPFFNFYGFYLSPYAGMNQDGWSDPTLNAAYAANTVASNPTTTSQQMSKYCVQNACNLPIATFQGIWYSTGKTDGIDFSAGTGFPYPQDWSPKK